MDTARNYAAEIERLARRYKLRQGELGKIVFGYTLKRPLEFGTTEYNHDKRLPKFIRLTSRYDGRHPDYAIYNSRSEKSRMSVSVVAHEFEHLLYQIRGNALPDFKLFEQQIVAIHEEYKREFDILTLSGEYEKRAEIFIGTYGHELINDFIAESFQEYQNCRHPSKYATKVGKLIDSWFKS